MQKAPKPQLPTSELSLSKIRGGDGMRRLSAEGAMEGVDLLKQPRLEEKPGSHSLFCNARLVLFCLYCRGIKCLMDEA